MSIQVQFRRGTSAQHSSFTGANGEITVNTDTKGLVVHDGSKVGGYPVGSYSEVVSSVSTNTNLSAPTTFYLASGTITLTLPTSVGNSGLKFQVKNNGTGTITILSQSGQTINGDINMIMTERNSVMGLISDGTNWNIF